jgi:hypothetical protein
MINEIAVASLLQDPSQAARLGLAVDVYTTLAKAWGETPAKAKERIEYGFCHCQSPKLYAATHLENWIREHCEGSIQPFLKYIDMDALARDFLEEGALVQATLDGQSVTIEPWLGL